MSDSGGDGQVSLSRVLGELKAAKAEIVKLQRELAKFAKQHKQGHDAIRCLVTQRASEIETAVGPPTPAAGVDQSGQMTMTPIGRLASCFVRLNGTPRNGGVCPHARATLTLTCPDSLAAVDGLAEFSHVWLVFGFHQNKKVGSAKPKVAPPKLGGARVGVFSTRAPYRPNAVGLSLARLDKLDGATLNLSGLDIVDGTPVYDLKPYIPSFDAPNESAVVQYPQWLRSVQAPEKLLRVVVTPEAKDAVHALAHHLVAFSSADEALMCLTEMLASDPRSVYRKTKCEGADYPLTVDALHVNCTFDDDAGIVTVYKVQLLAVTDYAQAPININHLGSIEGPT